MNVSSRSLLASHVLGWTVVTLHYHGIVSLLRGTNLVLHFSRSIRLLQACGLDLHRENNYAVFVLLTPLLYALFLLVLETGRTCLVLRGLGLPPAPLCPSIYR